MGLSASLWSSVSGLLVHGEKMNVIGNNIANVNTIGFKSQRMDFQDFIYQDGFSASGPVQIGRGAAVNCVLGDFSQGSFETTNDPMDMAIGGKGFFQVKDPYSDQVWYTRAGNFRFDKQGYLTNPQGLVLQGWKIDNRDGPTLATGASPTVTTKSAIQGSGVPMDIVLDSWTVPPKQTTKIQSTLNLTSDSGYDKTSSIYNPFFALSNRWNGKQPPVPAGSPPLSVDAYAYQSSIKVYDEGGSAHTVTTYFDQITSGLTLASSTSSTLNTATPGMLFGKNGFDATTPANVLATVNWKLSTLVPPGPILADTDIKIDVLPSGAWCLNLGAMVTAGTITSDQAMALRTDSAIDSWSAFGPPSSAPLADRIGVSDLPTGYKMYEYVVTMDPSEDMRTWGGSYDPITGLLTGAKSFQLSEKAGVLMIGTLTFNAAGQIVNQTAYTYMGNADPVTNATLNYDPDDYANWQPTAVSNNGLPVFTPNFTGQPMANSVRQDSSNNKPGGADYLIELDLGYKCIGNLNDPWGIGNPVIPPAVSSSANDAIGLGKTSYSNVYNLKEGKKEDSATTSLSGSSVTRYNYQNGYTSGDLSNTYTDLNGVIYGIYSNGVTMPLYQVTLYDFVDLQGLRRDGGNLYSATLESGNPKIGPAGQNGMGSINAYAIEQSNVDMAREFVQMITTQRGFQANSKSVTTVDTMLETVIQMKR